MTYEKRIAYILDIPKFTKKNEPCHTREFMKRLGNPQEKFRVIHVAGSNGKGSVCAFLNCVLVENGQNVGMFTSPHLVDIRERFLINGKPCSREQFLEAEKHVHQIVKQMQEAGLPHPTFFEYIFGVAMVLFAEVGLDCVILEAGLGGRLDATNIVSNPILTIITSISLEHTEILGNTIEKIAAEKAGIIKQGIPVIFDGNEPLAEKVILQAAEAMQSPAEKISWENINILLNDGKSIDFSVDCEYDVTRVRIPFPAEYQVMNGALALAALDYLQKYFNISKTALTKGFSNVVWPGRMEEIYPEVYLDGAHNVSGIQAFLNAVDAMIKQPAILLFSMVQEKDYEEAIRLICQKGKWEKIILTKISDNPRALDLKKLRACFATEFEQSRILSIEEPKDALNMAMTHKKQGQMLFCAGSLYLVGELKKITGGYVND